MGCARSLRWTNDYAALMEFLESDPPDGERWWAVERVKTLQMQRKPRFEASGIIWCGEGIVACACGFVAEYLCDYPLGEGRTCDTAVCLRCRVHLGPERDLCPIHAVQVLALTAAEAPRP